MRSLGRWFGARGQGTQGAVLALLGYALMWVSTFMVLPFAGALESAGATDVAHLVRPIAFAPFPVLWVTAVVAQLPRTRPRTASDRVALAAVGLYAASFLLPAVTWSLNLYGSEPPWTRIGAEAFALAFPWELPVWLLNLAILLAVVAYRRGRDRLTLFLLAAGTALGMTALDDRLTWVGRYDLELGYWAWLATPAVLAAAPITRAAIRARAAWAAKPRS